MFLQTLVPPEQTLKADPSSGERLKSSTMASPINHPISVCQASSNVFVRVSAKTLYMIDHQHNGLGIRVALVTKLFAKKSWDATPWSDWLVSGHRYGGNGPSF